MIFTENNAITTVLAPAADRFNTNPATATVKLSHYSHATFVVTEGAGGTGTATLVLQECSAANGSGATAIPFRYRISTDAGLTFGPLQAATASGVTPAAGANKVTVIEVDDRELSADKPWVRVQTTEAVDAPVAASITAILSKPRNARAVLISPA